jgi:predicted ATPase/DNA-binding NarL/FixJ family response regulator
MDTSQMHFPNHNLPLDLNAFIGRKPSISHVCRQLRNNRIRIVTLTGTGGVGKTRLTLQVAHALLNDFEHGVYFVPLAAVDHADQVLPTISQTLGLRESAHQNPLQGLKAYLQLRHILLLLDNFEHVLEAAPQIIELLSACARLKILVTSRSDLHVSGEHLYPVEPFAIFTLSKRNVDDLSLLRQVQRSEAGDLFVQRAQAAYSSFQLTVHNASVIAQICTRLEGIALAIELAAARIGDFTPQELLDQLNISLLTTLADGPHDVPNRQQTMRNTIEWSYRLLTSEQQIAFRYLSIFSGGWTAEATCAVIDLDCVMEHLEVLQRSNLVRRVENVGAEPRWTMLEVLREYGLEQLDKNADLQVARQKHAAHFLDLAEHAEPILFSPAREQWIARLETELNNIRNALSWFKQSGEIDLSLRLAGAVGWYWYFGGHMAEASQVLEDAIKDARASHRTVPWNALFGAGALAWNLGQHDTAYGRHGEGAALAQQAGDQRQLAYSLTMQGHATFAQGHAAEALMLQQTSLRLFRDFETEFGQVLALVGAGQAYAATGQYTEARLYLEEGLRFSTTIKDTWCQGLSRWFLGVMKLHQHQYAEARTDLNASVVVWQTMNDRWLTAQSLTYLTQAAQGLGDLKQASEHAAEALILYQELGDKANAANTLVLCAKLALSQQNYQEAATLFKQGRSLCEALNDAAGQAECEAGLARLEQESPASLESRLGPNPSILTPRERAVLNLVKRGWSNAKIAEKLVLSERTVHTHLRNIYAKLKISSREELIRYARQHLAD